MAYQYQLDNAGLQDNNNPLDNVLSLGGAGLSTYNQQQYYNNLQNALKTIGPTSLQGWNLNGPGGMSTGFNPATGTANMNLGSLNPAYNGFAGAAGGGASNYNSGLPSALAGNASSFLPMAGNQLAGAYGNYNAGMGAANQQLGNLGDFNSSYNNMLQAQYGQLQPQIQQQAFGLQNTLFGNGVADSTGAASGSLAAQNFGRGVGQTQSTAQLNAFQQALSQQNSAAANYGQLSNSANGILNNAFQNFGGTNQLISGLNTAGLTNAATAAQGAGALNTVGLNNYNASLQTGLGQGQVRNMSLFPYAQTALGLSNTPNGMGMGANFLSQAGANGGLQNLLGGLSKIPGVGNYLSNLLGPSNGGLDASQLNTLNSTDFSAGGDLMNGGWGDQTLNDWASLGDTGFPSASGGAADAGMVASDAQATSNAAFDAYSSSQAGADAAAGGADAAAGGSSLGSMAAMAAPGAAAIAGLYALYGLDQKQSQYTPEMAYTALMHNTQGMSPENAAATQQMANMILSGNTSGLFSGQFGAGTRYGNAFSRNQY